MGVNPYRYVVSPVLVRLNSHPLGNRRLWLGNFCDLCTKSAWRLAPVARLGLSGKFFSYFLHNAMHGRSFQQHAYPSKVGAHVTNVDQDGIQKFVWICCPPFVLRSKAKTWRWHSPLDAASRPRSIPTKRRRLTLS